LDVAQREIVRALEQDALDALMNCLTADDACGTPLPGHSAQESWPSGPGNDLSAGVDNSSCARWK
jgi:hypothetical protein